jgi:hypothetical protein
MSKTTTEGPEQATACPAWREDLKAFADGELPFLRRFAVRGHLSRCALCRDELREIARITMEIKATENMAAGATGGEGAATLAPDLRTRILDGLSGVTPEAPTAPLPLWRRQPGQVFGVGGVVAAVMVCTFYPIFNQAREKARQISPVAEHQVRGYSSGASAAAPAALRQEQAKTKSEAATEGPVDAQANYFGLQEQARFSRQLRPADALGTANTESNAPVPGATLPMAPPAPMPEYQVKGRTEAGEANRQNFDGPRVRRRGATAADKQLWANPASGAAAADRSSTYMAFIPERAVYKEASLGVAVDHIEAGSGKVEERVKVAGGFVVSNDLTTGADGYKSAELVVKVPVAQFDSVLADIAKMGEVRSKHLTGKDITEELSDATSDEQSLVNEVTALDKKIRNESMSERRTGQKEAELRAVRMQLARTRARLGLLRKMGELSTLNISLVEKAKKAAEAPPKPGWMRDLAQTNQAALLAFQTAIRVPIVLLVWILAFSPLWAPLLIAYRVAARRGVKAER